MKLYCVLLLIGACADFCINADTMPVGLYYRILRERNRLYAPPKYNWYKMHSSTFKLQDLLRIINGMRTVKETEQKSKRIYSSNARIQETLRSWVEERNGNTSGCTGVSSCWITNLGQGMSSKVSGKETELGAFGPGKK